MIYAFFKGLLKLVAQVFFRKIYFSGTFHVSLNKPTILACNHPNSFMDAILIGIFLKKPLHFLARSDVFNAPWKKWMLAKLHLIPVYRLEEGAQNLHKNQDTFTQCHQILKNNGIILIFSEGVCVLEKRLRPLRKGTARLAFGAEEGYGFSLDLEIVPVGINYTYPQHFRKEVMIGFAEPIKIKSIEFLYQENQAKAIRHLNLQIERGLRENMVIIENPDYDLPVENFLKQARLSSLSFYNTTWFSTIREHLDLEKQIASTDFNKQSLNQVLPTTDLKPIILKGNLFWLVIGFPFFITGFILNIIPLYLAQNLTNAKVKFREFYASVLLVVGLVFYLLYWFLFSFIIASFTHSNFFLIWLLLPLAGYVALLWFDQYQIFKAFRKKDNLNP